MVPFVIQFPMNSYGQEGGDCTFEVNVSPFQVNIEGGGVEHYVRVLTYTWYGNTAGAFVYIRARRVSPN